MCHPLRSSSVKQTSSSEVSLEERTGLREVVRTEQPPYSPRRQPKRRAIKHQKKRSVYFSKQLSFATILTFISSKKLSSNFTQRIQTAYLDALYAFLDGLVHVAFSDPAETTFSTAEMSSGSYQASQVDVKDLVSDPKS